MSRKSPYRSVRAPRTEFTNAIALDSAHATWVPVAGRWLSWYGAHDQVDSQPRAT
jgi:hypothetical protein